LRDEDGRVIGSSYGREGPGRLRGRASRTRRGIRRVCHLRPGDGDGWPTIASRDVGRKAALDHLAREENVGGKPALDLLARTFKPEDRTPRPPPPARGRGGGSGTGPHRTGRVRGRRTSSRDGVGEWRGAVVAEAFRERAPPGCGRAMGESTASKGATPRCSFVRNKGRPAPPRRGRKPRPPGPSSRPAASHRGCGTNTSRGAGLAIRVLPRGPGLGFRGGSGGYFEGRRRPVPLRLDALLWYGCRGTSGPDPRR